MRKLVFAAALSAGLLSSALAAPIQWTTGAGANGHWYEFVRGPVTAQDAFALAGASTFSGLTGYLATVTTAQENAFVSSNVAQGALAWLGGSDSGVEGTWKWMVGPEAGQTFVFSAWGSGEPNDVNGGEDFVHTNWCGTGCWNDHGGPGSSIGQANGYIIEYSAKPTNVPEPMTLALVLPALLAAGYASHRRA